MHGILEHEAAETASIDLLFFDQFVGFGHHFGHVLDVEVADVRAEQRLDLGAARIAVAVERPGVVGVVRFAAEIERFHEQRLEVVLVGDCARRVVVEFLDSPGGALVVGRADAAAGADRLRHFRARVLLGQGQQHGRVEIGRVHVLQGLAVADAPVADEVGVQQAGEAHAAFQEGEVEFWEAPRDAA